MFLRPSFFSFGFQGILLLIIAVMFYQNYNTLNNKEIITYLLLASISIGIHSSLHYREEKDFGFNPMRCRYYQS
jgi:hypothetical protein